jgi:hypothetical protein
VTDSDPQPPDEADAVEVVDGLPVLSSDNSPTAVAEPQPSGGLVPARQVAALAATGFVAGAATVAVFHHRRARPLSRRKRAKKRTALGEVVTSNSFLVDVHLLRRD